MKQERPKPTTMEAGLLGPVFFARRGLQSTTNQTALTSIAAPLTGAVLNVAPISMKLEADIRQVATLSLRTEAVDLSLKQSTWTP